MQSFDPSAFTQLLPLLGSGRSFLLVLIPVFAGVSGSERLFPLTALVVLLSVTGHGAMLVWATHWLKRRPEPVGAQALPGAERVAHPELISFEELDALKRAGYAVSCAASPVETFPA